MRLKFEIGIFMVNDIIKTQFLAHEKKTQFLIFDILSNIIYSIYLGVEGVLLKSVIRLNKIYDMGGNGKGYSGF